MSNMALAYGMDLGSCHVKSVLLIDDDRVIRAPLSWHLRQEGWTVIEADDGEMGLMLFRKHRPEVVVTDLLMPSINGFEVISELRKDSAAGHARIIALSSKSFPSDKEKALQLGADLFLVKPIVPATLSLLLDELTAGSRGAQEAPQAEKATMLARFWGVRGSVPSPGPSTVFYGGNTSCVEVRAEGEIIILDAGTGIRELGSALAEEFADRELKVTILITHTHWDHIQGFPYFKPAYDPKNQIRVLGYKGTKAGLAEILSQQMETSFFPVRFDNLPSNISISEIKEMEFEIGKVKVRTMFLNHPGVCVGYRLETSHGSLAYLPDNEPFQRRHVLQREANILPADSAENTAFAYAEDEKIVGFIRGVDSLIIDAQYDTAEYNEHIGWGHGCADDAVELALRAGIKRLYLFHHDPNHDDPTVTRMVESARKLAQKQTPNLQVFAAREGETCRWPIGG